jgi:hypothetical protein
MLATCAVVSVGTVESCAGLVFDGRRRERVGAVTRIHRAGLLVLAGILALSDGQAAGQTPAAAPRVADPSELAGRRWLGSTRVELAGFENLGGGYVVIPDHVAVTMFRSRRASREWIVTTERQVGRVGDHAVWEAADYSRARVRAGDVSVAFSCKPARRGLGHGGFIAGLIGLVGSRDHAIRQPRYGLLRAQRAWQVSSDGRMRLVEEPVVCDDVSYGM